MNKRNTLVYLAGPYSKAEDKNKLMEQVMTVAGKYMIANPGSHVVSPLYMHYALPFTPEMGSDYNFFGDYSRNLLRRCDLLLVVMLDGWDESTGVADEIATAEKLGIPIEYVDPITFRC